MITGASLLGLATAYTRRGWRVVPIPFREKGPRVRGWQNLRLGLADLPRYFGERPHNIGVLLGEPSGWLVDVDLDCAEAVELAPLFLPATSSVFGRPSKRRSHYLYTASGASTVRFQDPLGEKPVTLVELRSTGGQTVLPGSVHPSGELVAFSADGRPAEVDAERLRDAVARLAAACLLVRHGWERQDAIAACNGEAAFVARLRGAAGVLARRWLGLEDTERPRRHPTSPERANDFASAVARYNADHAQQWLRRPGACPACGHRGCFHGLPGTDRWVCHSAAHTAPGVVGNGCHTGDVLDLDAHAAGVSPAALLRREGYLRSDAMVRQRRAVQPQAATRKEGVVHNRAG